MTIKEDYQLKVTQQAEIKRLKYLISQADSSDQLNRNSINTHKNSKSNPQHNLFNIVSNNIVSGSVKLVAFPDHLIINENENTVYVQPVQCAGAFPDLLKFVHSLESNYGIDVISTDFMKEKKQQTMREQIILTIYLNEVH
jgi:hypothetical protein